VVVAAVVALTAAGVTAAAAATDPLPAPGLSAGVASIGGGLAESSVDLYYLRTDKRLVLKNGSGLTDLGGVLTSGVAAIAARPTASVSKSVYARGGDNAIWYRNWASGPGEWGAWQSLTGRATGAPGVTCVGDGSGEPVVYVRGTDGAMWRRTASTAWATRGGNLTSDPAGLASSGGICPAAEHAFALGGDGAVWEWTATGWLRVGGRSTVAPSATLLPDGGIDLFVRGTNNVAYVAHRDAGATSFGPFEVIGGTFTSPVTGFVDTTEPADRLVLGIGTDGSLWVASDELGDPASWVWSQVP
jgi:hypothetical protein